MSFYILYYAVLIIAEECYQFHNMGKAINDISCAIKEYP